MIPIQYDGPDPAASEQGPEVLADELRAGRRVEPHAGIVRRLVMRAVLQRDRVDRYSLRAIGLDIAAAVFGERGVSLGAARPLNQTPRGLHPARRASGPRHYLAPG